MTEPLRVLRPIKAQTSLPAGSARRVLAEQWLEELLVQWRLQPGMAGRWLAGADVHLRGDHEVTLRAEYDPGIEVFTVEILRGGRRIYGIDDWLGIM